MAHGISAYLGNAWMDALGNATSFSVATPYVKLHTNDPGPAGTATENAVALPNASIQALPRYALIPCAISLQPFQ